MMNSRVRRSGKPASRSIITSTISLFDTPSSLLREERVRLQRETSCRGPRPLPCELHVMHSCSGFQEPGISAAVCSHGSVCRRGIWWVVNGAQSKNMITLRPFQQADLESLPTPRGGAFSGGRSEVTSTSGLVDVSSDIRYNKATIAIWTMSAQRWPSLSSYAHVQSQVATQSKLPRDVATQWCAGGYFS